MLATPPAVAASPVHGLLAAGLVLAGAAAALPHAPAWGAALLCGGLGLAMALPAASDAALRRGHELSRYAEGGVVRRLLAGPGLRVGRAVAVGTALSAVLLVRLAAGGAGVWVSAALAALAAILVLRLADGPARRVWSGPHAAAGLRGWAQGAGAVAALLGALAAGRSGALPDPGLVPATASVLVAEMVAMHRLWAGAEAWLLGQAVALSVVPPWVATLGVVLGNGAVGLAVARLAIAAQMSSGDLRRAVAPASDAGAPPPPSAPGPGPVTPAVAVAALAVLLASGLGAHWAEARLAPLPAELRPTARVQVAADRIGGAFHAPGTVARVLDGRDGLVRADADLAARLRGATDAGFDRVVANVDPFLDGYYSLWGEYARMLDLGRGRLEERLSWRLAEALAAGAPFADLEAMQAEVAALRAAAARLEQDAGALPGARLPPLNPGEVRTLAAIDVLPPPPDLRTPGLTTSVEARAGVSVTAGVIGALVARRVVARLAARGVVGLAVRAIPIVGVAVGVATDAALVELEEAMNRAAFRAEIVAAIEAQRQAALALLD